MNPGSRRLALALFVVLATTGWVRRASAWTVSDPASLPEPASCSSAGMSLPASEIARLLWALENDPRYNQPWATLLPYDGANTSSPTSAGPSTSTVSAVANAEQLPPPALGHASVCEAIPVHSRSASVSPPASAALRRELAEALRFDAMSSWIDRLVPSPRRVSQGRQSGTIIACVIQRQDFGSSDWPSGGGQLSRNYMEN